MRYGLAILLAITATLLVPQATWAQIPVTVDVEDTEEKEAPAAPADDPSRETTPENLPRTGSDLFGIVVLAGSLLVVGTALWVGSANRRREI